MYRNELLGKRKTLAPVDPNHVSNKRSDDRFIRPFTTAQQRAVAQWNIAKPESPRVVVRDQFNFANHQAWTLFGASKRDVDRQMLVQHRRRANDPSRLLFSSPPKLNGGTGQRVSLHLDRMVDGPDISKNRFSSVISASATRTFFAALGCEIYSLCISDGVVKEHSLKSGTEFTAITSSANAGVLVTIDQQATLQSYDVNAQRVGMERSLSSDSGELAFTVVNIDTKSIAMGSTKGNVYFFDERMLKPSSIQIGSAAKSICRLGYNGANQLAVGDSQGQCMLWDIRKTAQPRARMSYGAAITALSFAHKKPHLLALGVNNKAGTLSFVDTRGDTSRVDCHLDSHISSANWMPKSGYLITTTFSGDVAAWEYQMSKGLLLQVSSHQYMSRIYNAHPLSYDQDKFCTTEPERETLSFWTLRQNKAKAATRDNNEPSSLLTHRIR